MRTTATLVVTLAATAMAASSLAGQTCSGRPYYSTGPMQVDAGVGFGRSEKLYRAGFNVGKVDGVLGQQSRAAVKAMQIKYGLPADSWPTAELLARMRGGTAQAQPAGMIR